jgi:hypothetical protein
MDHMEPPVSIYTDREVCSFALGRGKYCSGNPRFPATHAVECPNHRFDNA